MKSMTKNFLYIICLFALLALSACTVPSSQIIQSEGSVRHINVTGIGKVYLKPDIANINVGVQTQSDDAAKALSENNRKADNIHKKLAEMGVDEKDIQTTSMNIYPQHQYDSDGSISSTVYRVENSVNITIRDIDRLGDTLDSVVQSGANSINQINFDVADKEAALSQARKLAVEDAHQQAVELADAAGIELGKLININANPSSSTQPVYQAKMAFDMVQSVESVPIASGELVVSMQANLIYGIK